MLDIIINSTRVDLAANFGLTIEMVNPLFEYTLKSDSYSYPITLPASDKNRRVFGFAHIPESISGFTPLPCSIVCDGVLMVEGEFWVQRADAQNYQGFVIGRYLPDKLLETPLRDIDLGGDVVVAYDMASMISHGNDMTAYPWSGNRYAFFPMRNLRFMEPSGNNGTVNIYAPHLDSFTWDQVVSSWEFPVVPFPYVMYILGQIAEAAGLVLSGTWAADTEIKQLVVYNTFNLRNLTNWTINVANHVPDITVQDFIDALQSMFNIAIYVDKVAGKLVFDKRVLSAQALPKHDWTEQAAPNAIVEKPKNQFSGYLFTMERDEADGLSIYPERLTNDYGYWVGSVPNAAALPLGAPRDLVYWVEDERTWYKQRYQDNWVETRYYGFAHRLRVDNGQFPITTAASTLQSRFLSDANGGPYTIGYWEALYPVAYQIGQDITKPEMMTDSEYSLRLLFYRGMRICNVPFPAPPTTDFYPMGAADVWEINGAQIGNYALRWDGEFGLYETWYKDWLPIVQNAKTVSFSLRLSAAQLSLFRMTDKVVIDRNTYFVERLTMQMTVDGLKSVTAKCILA